MENKRNNYSSDRHSQKNISGCVTVTLDECHGNADKMVRRFVKKVKKEGIVDEFLAHAHYTKPSEVRREARRQRQRVIEKVNKQRQELLKPRDARFRPDKKRRRIS